MNIDQHPNRDISPRTIHNFKRAKAHEIMGPGNSVIYVNLWCDGFFLFPKRYREYSIPWWELESTIDRQVNVTRFYWLKFGLAIVRPTY